MFLACALFRHTTKLFLLQMFEGHIDCNRKYIQDIKNYFIRHIKIRQFHMENTFDLQRKHAEEKLSLEELVDIYNNDLFESYPLIKIGFLYWDSFENIDK